MTALYFHFGERADSEALDAFMAECASRSLPFGITDAIGWGSTVRITVSRDIGAAFMLLFSDWKMSDPLGFKAKIVDQRLAAHADRTGPMSG